MPPADLLRLLRRVPFEPFRIHLTDGTVYEIRHPELVIVGAASAVVAFPDPSVPGQEQSWEIIALRHVTRLEPIQPTAASA
jgi:hypothetical protein